MTAVQSKSTRTRSAIIDAALKLFRERGYDATTMRAIAAEAGVAVGNAYYYFASKEHLIQGFYDRAQTDLEAAVRPMLDGNERDLEARIVSFVETWLDTMDVYKPFAGSFFKNAADPTSPLSPFSAESGPARARAIALWQQILEGSDARVPKRLRAELPELLWLYFMGLVLLWVHDPSADGAAVRTVLRRTAPLVVKAIQMARLPVMRGMLDDIVAVIAEIEHVFALAAPPPSPSPSPD